ncbi:hypothetical protein K439DRAFT_1623052 [Ramaria rubella]|nr:hypothetical protein K439DRAFT_1623052 [Ramaria rubella]
MFHISKTHGLQVSFACALRDALFVPDQEDKKQISAYGASLNPPRTWDDLLCNSPSWLWRHCKHIIPPPEELYPMVAKMFHTYGPLQDAKTGLPLFNTAAWHVAKNILSIVQLGYVSDYPGIALYSIGVDGTANGLPIYHCVRGTNLTEGGVHKHICEKLPISGVSPHHFMTRLLDFVLTHNLYNSLRKFPT